MQKCQNHLQTYKKTMVFQVRNSSISSNNKKLMLTLYVKRDPSQPSLTWFVEKYLKDPHLRGMIMGISLHKPLPYVSQ